MNLQQERQQNKSSSMLQVPARGCTCGDAALRTKHLQILVSVTCSGGLLSWSEEPLQKTGTAPAGVPPVSTTVCHHDGATHPWRQRPQPALGLVTTVLGKTTGGSACLLSKRQAKPFITSLWICQTDNILNVVMMIPWRTLLWPGAVLNVKFWKVRWPP